LFRRAAILLTPLCLLAASIAGCKEDAVRYQAVRHAGVYFICPHNDSIYFSTKRDGIYRFHPRTPAAITPIAHRGSLPLRMLAFADTNRLAAISYVNGLNYLDRDSLLPQPAAAIPGWVLRQDDQSRLWIVGPIGIYTRDGRRFRKFHAMTGGHDVAFSREAAAVAQLHGITLLSRGDGRTLRECLPGTNFWCISRHGAHFIAGGVNRCVFLDTTGRTVRQVSFGPRGNIAWATAVDTAGVLYLATEKGLLRAGPASRNARLIGFRDTCIKSIYIDRTGMLWVGRFEDRFVKPR
jgi:hypothetical protein